MVWVHGGALITGTATCYNGSALAAYGDVVVVTVQYRLGVLGFFSTGDEHAPGNQGFLDVVAALHWVQGNITPFGGDLNCVTIYGGSAGGSIISGLVLSPMAAGLFHRAITQSGVITTPGIIESHPWPLAQKITNTLACSSSSPAEMVQCLRQKEGEELVLSKKLVWPPFWGWCRAMAQRGFYPSLAGAEGQSTPRWGWGQQLMRGRG
ncbi:carboxylesterase 3-like [Pan troglodytes]|uniref:carboxylesterase 3-like n=1 Tax=Pan troglodytes TaxID=9598 RepID=UPI0030133044